MMLTSVPVMPIRHYTHPLVHFFEFANITWTHISMRKFKKHVMAHVIEHAGSPKVIQAFQETAWDVEFYGWVFILYNLRLIPGKVQTFVVFMNK